MTDGGSKKRLSRRKDQTHPDSIQNVQSAKPKYHPAGADHYPVPPRPLHSGTPQSIHEPQFPGYGAVPPDPGDYGTSPFPSMQSPHYDYYPPTTMRPYMQKPGAHSHLRSGSTDRFDGEYGQGGSSPSGSLSKSSGLVPNIVEPQQELRPHSKKSVQTEAIPEGQRGTHAFSQFATLEDEYATLYQKRHEIGVRMEDIKKSLTAERYAALVAKLDPQELATLKPWSDNTGN